MAMMMGRWFLTVTIGAALTASGCGPTPSTTVIGESGVVLPTGRVLRPTGRTIDVGNMPLAITIAPGGRFAMLLLSGWRERGLPTYTRYREREIAASQLEARLAETQLRMLRMQLNPHFLFNAMNTVAMLTRAGRSSESIAMLLELSALMRDALRGDAPDSSPLADELNLLGRYVGVEQVRFGGNLAFDVDVPAPLMRATVPSFLLQPLVENAIRHGRAGSDGVARTDVRAERAEDRLILSVWDDGTGAAVPMSDSHGVGLQNVRERLRQLYGAVQSFEIDREDEGTMARISIPIQFATAVG